MEKKDLKILLLQIRKDPKIKIQEHQAFCEFTRIDKDQLEVLDVFENLNFNNEVLKGMDALFIGGTSEANVLKPDCHPFLENCYNLINFCVSEKIPVFASCFGFQLAVIAFGGEIIHQEVGFEMGTVPITLDSQSKEDHLFKDTIDNFYAVSVHKQKAIELPEGCVRLAYTDSCIHAFKVKESPFWAFQFHPEVSKEHLIERLAVYQAQYTSGGDHFSTIINKARETPESALLLKKFVDRILLS